MPVSVGMVGYLSKHHGKFITLLNSLEPRTSQNVDVHGLKPLRCYGSVEEDHNHYEEIKNNSKRIAMRRRIGTFFNFFTSKKCSETSTSRYSFPLHAGHETAHLVAEAPRYTYFRALDAPKKWFQSNIEKIIEVYGETHQIQKEDLCLGTRRAIAF
ncbi:hypothetical protein H0H81_012078 [Sphagnurus paluster]|uniref:Uncharacterized protein n=1 Tax=Sphagnurus paluster TaxID=117069 RepID=A0A9P7K3I8_9AGAR|nr:hypothetical protein H0H81_012078 [Sphagnurus paluster]